MCETVTCTSGSSSQTRQSVASSLVADSIYDSPYRAGTLEAALSQSPLGMGNLGDGWRAVVLGNGVQTVNESQWAPGLTALDLAGEIGANTRRRPQQ
jgi:hypothetical protein